MDYDFNALIAQAQSGDNAAIERVIKKYKYLIYFVTKKMNLAYGNNREDFYQLGSIGLFKAINNYNASKGFKFVTYAQDLITNEIIDFLRKHKKTYSEIYDCLENIASTYSEDFTIENIDLKNALNKLSPRLKCIIELTFFNEFTQIEIAKLYKVDRSYVSKLKDKALIELKKYLSS